MMSNRALLAGIGGLVCVSATSAARADALPDISMARHEKNMRLAIEQGRKNPRYPFGAVIVRAANDELIAKGTNDVFANPILHGEIACMNDYVRAHGNRDWEEMVLYTTAEPCPMCMTALIWANIGGVVFATSAFEGLRKAGMEPIRISAKDLVEATPFHRPMLLGGVLAAETDRLFLERQRN